jgi:hypothetical protein
MNMKYAVLHLTLQDPDAPVHKFTLGRANSGETMV